MRAMVTGMVATYSMGGVAWDYGQYALGLERLGFEVFYLEDCGVPAYSYNADTGMYEEDPASGVDFLRRTLAELSPGLEDRWHYRSVDGRSYGLDEAEVAEVVGGADVFLNVSGCSVLREEYRRCPRKVFIDTDPGWNHFVIFPRWDAKPAEERKGGYRSHDHFFTYAARLGEPDCPLPDFGVEWRPTFPPVVLDRWHARPPGDTWTTVMNWKNYPDVVEHEGVIYGGKEVEFEKIEDLPGESPGNFEVAINVNGEAPLGRWRETGWSVVGGHERSSSLGSYREYIEGSRGELSVAKNIYAATRCGWFSCRSVCYLAAGRPVIMQNTGFPERVPTGAGLFAFSDLGEAARSVKEVESDYEAHSRAASELARDRFDSDVVLGEMLGKAGVG